MNINAKNLKIILGAVVVLLGVTGIVLGIIKLRKERQVASQQSSANVFVGTKTIVFYFNRGIGCITCERIGGIADETIQQDFAQQIKDGQLERKFVNYQLPENQHFEKLFNLSGSNIVVARIEGGQLKSWRTLNKMWGLKDTATLKKYIHDEVQVVLDGGGAERVPASQGGFVAVLLLVGWVVWLGLLTSISPCPLATNIAAVSFIGGHVASRKGVLWSGFMYTVGRAVVYIVLASLILAGLFQSSVVSAFLEDYLNIFVGPVLLLAAPVMLGWVGSKLTFTVGSEKLHKRFAKAGGIGAVLLGMLFALSLCPISAGIFFGPFLLTAADAKSSILLPTVYGIATGLPVFGFAIILAFASNYLGKTFNLLTAFEKWARLITGLVFVLVGIYMTLLYTMGIVIL